MPTFRPLPRPVPVAAVTLAALLLSPGFSTAQTPLYQWQFNETGTTAPSTNPSSPTVDLSLFNGAGVASDLHTAAGFGPGGGTNRAYDGTSASGHGNTGSAGARAVASGFTNTTLDADSSFTLTGWLRTPTAVNGSAKIVIFGDNAITGDGSANSASVAFNSSGQLTFDARNSTGGGNVVVSSSAFLPSTDTWYFFAVTYSGLNASNVSFYRGSESVSATATDTLHIAEQPIVDFNGAGTTSKIFIGNRQDGLRPFDGYIDDIRFYSDVLSGAQIEAVRASAIPEPSAFVALAGSATLLFAGARRRRRA